MITIKELIEHLNDLDQHKIGGLGRTIEYDILVLTNQLINHLPKDQYYRINRKYLGFTPNEPDVNTYYANVFVSSNTQIHDIYTDITRVDIKFFYPTVIKHLMINNIITEFDDDIREEICFLDAKRVFIYLLDNYEEYECSLVRKYINGFYILVKHQVLPYLSEIHEQIRSCSNYFYIDVDHIFVNDLEPSMFKYLDSLDLNYHIRKVEYFSAGSTNIGYYEKLYNTKPYRCRLRQDEIDIIEDKIKILNRDKVINELFNI